MDHITAFQAVTLAIAAVGAALGIINTWRSIDQGRVKLKVVPSRAIPVGNAPGHVAFCVQVTNLSQFAVTIEDAGVFFHGTKKRGSIVSPIFSDDGGWPRRLEPRSSVAIYSEAPRSSKGYKVKCAFARTQCGRTKTGSSPALRAMNKARGALE